MTGEITLAGALAQLEGSTLAERSKGIANLKQVLRHNQHSSKLASLGDVSFHRIYEVLFQVAVTEKSSWLKAATKTTRSAADTRLSGASGALRLAVDVGFRGIKLKTVRALLDHFTGTLLNPGGDLCSPLALDYAKSFRTVLSYQPHVEHLPKDEWERLARFCLDLIHDPSVDDGTVSGAEVLSTAGTTNGTSYRSSRSQLKDLSGSQGTRPLWKQISEEMVAALSLLTAAPNAPIECLAAEIVWALVNYMKQSSIAGKAHSDAFATINNLLQITRTEDINLTLKITSHLLRMARHFWPTKPGSLSHEILKMLLFLRPFITHLMSQEEASALRTEIYGLLDVLRAEYGRRSERDQLQTDYMRMEMACRNLGRDENLCTPIYSLRSVASSDEKRDRAERDWVLVDTLAFLSRLLTGSIHEDGHTSEDDADAVNQRPRKRQRLSDEFGDLVASSTRGAVGTRICALQTMTFLAQAIKLSPRRMAKMIDHLSVSCNDDNNAVATWALLALTSCGAQATATDDSLSTRWAAAWQLAMRAMGNTLTSRAACHFLSVALQLRLVAQTTIADLIQTLSSSMDLSGPSILADSVLRLLRLVLGSVQELNPQASAGLSESFLSWLSRTFLPSRFEDKAFAAVHNLFHTDDLVQLVFACLGQSQGLPTAYQVPLRNELAQASIKCAEQQSLVSYLLLLPNEKPTISQDLEPSFSTTASASPARLSCEAQLLNHLSAELSKCEELWKEWKHTRARNISMEQFTFLCQACGIVCCIIYGHSFRDTRRLAGLRKQLANLLESIAGFAASSNCGQEKVDAMLLVCSEAFPGLGRLCQSQPYTFSESETVLCPYIHGALTAKRQAGDSAGLDDDDLMDIADEYDSQDSRRDRTTSDTHVLRSDSTVAYSCLSLRSTVELYCAVAEGLSRPDIDISLSACIVDNVLAFNDAQILSSGAIVSRLPSLGLTLDPEDLLRLLEYCTETFCQSYSYERNEVAIGAVVEIITSLTEVWTVRANKVLFELGEDTYEWYIKQLTAGVLSPNVQKRLGTVLLQLCHIDLDYGRETDVPSARTSLFKLLNVGNIQVQYHLAERISTIFGRFVLSEHDAIFDDLQSSLPADVECLEGLAMRMLFLARLASSWHSLLRNCVYYIFDVAGRVEQSARYAAHCIVELTRSLHLKSSTQLFQLFAPQLLHTWLEDQALAGLPYAAFQYASLGELLERNKIEITAQLIMRGKEDGLQYLSSALQVSVKDLAKKSFAKSLAYAMGWDVTNSTAESAVSAGVNRLRDILGKEDYKRILGAEFSAAMGHFYLSMQLDDNPEKWMTKKNMCTSALKALTEIKGYAYSPHSLPTTQQPSFKARYLPDQIERLCKRVGVDPTQPWSLSSFALAARMLLDAVNDALGPLHMNVMLRKLRMLICMGGEVALTGFPVEMLVHFVRPFLSNSQCADDAIGILQYLLERGKSHFETDGAVFANGSVILMILRMAEHSNTRQDSTTQESQHKKTVEKMEAFKLWLVRYFQRRQAPEAMRLSGIHARLVNVLGALKLPGNARRDSPESALLLLLLETLQSGSESFLQRQHCTEALTLITKKFDGIVSHQDDCLEDDSASARYVNVLWHVSRSTCMDDGFLSWTAGVFGRAYASTGKRPEILSLSKQDEPAQIGKVRKGVRHSQAKIVHGVSELVLSQNRSQAGCADWTLRNITFTFHDGDEALEYEQMLPAHVYAAIEAGTQGYDPPGAPYMIVGDVGREQIRHALEISPQMSDEDWTKRLAIIMCRWAKRSKLSILPALPALLETVEHLARTLLPPIAHILLTEEAGKDQIFRAELSAAITAHFDDFSSNLLSRQRFFLDLILYLRSQPFPGETTKADRTRWLDLDLLQAAGAAARCSLPTTALLLAESAPPVAQPNRRSSARSSMLQLVPVDIPADLLLTIFKEVEEPDSFYAVQQPASLEAVLGRLDYEEDGYKSLMFRSAQMDSAMRHAHRPLQPEYVGIMRSLSALNLSSLEFALLSGQVSHSVDHAGELLNAATKLQQWDLPVPQNDNMPAATRFTAYQELSRCTDHAYITQRLRSLLLSQVQQATGSEAPAQPSIAWCNTLASLTELGEAVNCTRESQLRSTWHRMQERAQWMQKSRFEDCQTIVSGRSTLFSILSQNKLLLNAVHTNAKAATLIEAEALIQEAKLARHHGILQEALSASTQITALISRAAEVGLDVAAAAGQETAMTLWEANEAAASVKLLRNVLEASDVNKEAIPIGRAGLLAELAHQLADARLEKPGEILERYLKPAITQLNGHNIGDEAGKVHFEFARFCDQQLQNPGNIQDFNRIVKLRQQKADEVQELKAIRAKGRYKASGEREDVQKAAIKAQKWFDIDDAEYNRLKAARDNFTQESLKNYMLALQASDQYDICVLRFFAMWLENGDSNTACTLAKKYLPSVPSWKFAVLINQLVSRLESDSSPFQASLQPLVHRICLDHPHHSLHQLYAATRKPAATDMAAQSRFKAAQGIRAVLQKTPEKGDFVSRFFSADGLYRNLAQAGVPPSRNGKLSVQDIPEASQTAKIIPTLRVPPATISLPLRPDGQYNDVPTVARWDPAVSIMSGLSKPKALKAIGSDGQAYKQLFKSGEQTNDDLRQDAIMEQVFEEVSKMLRKHKTTRQRNLQIRGYKVIPLSANSGMIEFVPNSIPIGDYLKPAHLLYYPDSIKQDKARERIHAVQDMAVEVRIKEYRKVCDQLPPVMRYFFLERFEDPDEWFQKRTNYTRTTASASILGWVLGLGDRHLQNILLDEVSGDVVHIDLGVAFEAGRVLNFPETVPFRLSRDVVDGMGVTKTEGIFRRCCEFTMDALREERESIMTLLNVLRYDPLYIWTVSSLRAKRMQDAQETGHKGLLGEDEASSKRREQEAGEAGRALSIVEKKLSKTLSTAATVSELIQEATDEKNLATLWGGWSAWC